MLRLSLESPWLVGWRRPELESFVFSVFVLHSPFFLSFTLQLTALLAELHSLSLTLALELFQNSFVVQLRTHWRSHTRWLLTEKLSDDENCLLIFTFFIFSFSSIFTKSFSPSLLLYFCWYYESSTKFGFVRVDDTTKNWGSWKESGGIPSESGSIARAPRSELSLFCHCYEIRSISSSSEVCCCCKLQRPNSAEKETKRKRNLASFYYFLPSYKGHSRKKKARREAFISIWSNREWTTVWNE